MVLESYALNSRSPAGMSATDAHDHAGETHGGHIHPVLSPEPDTRGRQQRRLLLILALTCGVAVLELVGGTLSSSLALVADAGHMVTDSSALGLSLAAVWLMGRGPSVTRTYGFRRVELLAAFINAMALVALALWIVWEAVQRIQQ